MRGCQIKERWGLFKVLSMLFYGIQCGVAGEWLLQQKLAAATKIGMEGALRGPVSRTYFTTKHDQHLH